MRKIKIAFYIILSLALLALLGIYLTNTTVDVLEPKGQIAAQQKSLIITATALMLIVVIPIFIMIYYLLKKYRADRPQGQYTPDWAHSHWIEAIWWGVPCLIIVFLSILAWKSSHDLDPFKPIENGTKPLTIQVVALQWKWLFIYPEQGIATVNFLQFPEKTPLNFELTGDAPMNSFWIPQLGGQVYAMAGMRTKLHLIANEPGAYRGCSANISGTGFAGMKFTAKATSAQDFAIFIAKTKKTKNALNFTTYQALAKPSENNPVASYIVTENNLFDRIIMACLED